MTPEERARALADLEDALKSMSNPNDVVVSGGNRRGLSARQTLEEMKRGTPLGNQLLEAYVELSRPEWARDDRIRAEVKRKGPKSFDNIVDQINDRCKGLAPGSPERAARIREIGREGLANAKTSQERTFWTVFILLDPAFGQDEP